MKQLRRTACGLPGLMMIAAMLLTGCHLFHSKKAEFIDLNQPPPAPVADQGSSAPAPSPGGGSSGSTANTSSLGGSEFRVGDKVTVTFSGNMNAPAPHEERIRDDGTITVPLIVGDVKAVGKTPAQLQKELTKLYVPKIFSYLTVTVSGESRLFWIDGEVKGPGPREYPGEMTIVKAISYAGGFTDFAKRWAVRVTRTDGRSEIIDVDKAIRNPELDVKIYPGDKIYVPRRLI